MSRDSGGGVETGRVDLRVGSAVSQWVYSRACMIGRFGWSCPFTS